MNIKKLAIISSAFLSSACTHVAVSGELPAIQPQHDFASVSILNCVSQQTRRTGILLWRETETTSVFDKECENLTIDLIRLFVGVRSEDLPAELRLRAAQDILRRIENLEDENRELTQILDPSYRSEEGRRLSNREREQAEFNLSQNRGKLRNVDASIVAAGFESRDNFKKWVSENKYTVTAFSPLETSGQCLISYKIMGRNLTKIDTCPTVP